MTNLRNILTLAICVFVALFATGCGGDETYKPTAQGAPYEIVVVADHSQWDGAPGDTLRSIFYKQFPMISRQETLWDVLRVLPSGFKKLTTRYRNVLMVNVDPRYTDPSLTVREDVYAAPQTILVASAADNAAMTRLLDANRDDILATLERAERERDVRDAEGHTPPQIKELIKNKFGFEMGMGPGYKVRSDKPDFLWISYEMPISSQGIIIYTYPFSGIKDFERASLLSRRDEFTALIPGENPGSHMSTNPDYIEVVYKKIDDRSWAQMHGFWDVKGDFMGGPFVGYSTLDAANQRVIAIDFYVYSPDHQLSQRNYIKQLEHYLYSVKIPDDRVEY